jgi:hypothetical protein
MDVSDCWICFNRLKESTSTLLAAIRVLDSPLGHHTESELAIDLYSCSTSIANMDESDHRISFNLLKKSSISLPLVIGALNSPLGLHSESDLSSIK